MNEAEKPELKPANDNPWYWLATLYGECKNDSEPNQDIAQKNRNAWNRWFAKELSKKQRAALPQGAISPEDLTPLNGNEETALAAAFTKRSGRVDQLLPDRTKEIDFSHTIFDSHVNLLGFIFPNDANSNSATFSEGADFTIAMFAELAIFDSATFSKGVDFNSAKFSGDAGFDSATFSRETPIKSADC